jgi:GTP cyclohydrolase IA
MGSDWLDDPDIADAVAVILGKLGYDINDQHFQDTPSRVTKMLLEFEKNGGAEVVGKLLEIAFIEKGAISSLVLEGPISYTSMCAHHMLPVTGHAWIGYLPSEKVCGLSKLARITYHFAQQLTVQERVTQEIADALDEHLKPEGAMVVIRAQHGCMSIRGVKEREARTTTSAVRGVFKESAAARNEFLSLMQLRSS